MDYILKKIQQHTRLYPYDKRKVVELYRLQVEYACVFLLGYLWNKNIADLDEDERESIFRNIKLPTIGTIVKMCRTLDKKREFFGKNKTRISLDDYPKLRNEKFGHGFLFDDGIDDFTQELEKLLKNLFDGDQSILTEDFDLVLVTRQTDDSYSGSRFNAVDNSVVPWICSKEIGEFQLDNVYAVRSGNTSDYLRLSPFIVITSNLDEFYIFRDVSERMLGLTTYNRVLSTGSTRREWPDFAEDISNDGVKRKSVNGTILNVYENNYSQYIDVGPKKEIKNFLLNNKASVCATVWGHGGVGKTATVQSVCEDLSRAEDRSIDYIVFASAKDRAFSYHSGEINTIDDPIDSYRNLLKCINATIGCEDVNKEDGIIEFEGQLLLVIDDYETFPPAEQEKIKKFIRSLNINHHKVLLTTRANVIIGEEFPTHELLIEHTIRFLVEVMRCEFPDYHNQVKDELKDKVLRQKVFFVTSGRPLFIFQFAHIWAQSGSLENAVRHNIKDREKAIEFLYGRIYKYLSYEGRTLFRAISLLVTEGDLSNLINKLQYIVNMERDDDRFNRGMEDLIKLRIIEIFENDFFRVYSSEILEIMQNEFKQAPGGWRGSIKRRLLQVTRDKKIDTEQALLENANGARYSRTEKDVEGLYRQILNRSSSPKEIRSQAILNFTDYLFNDRSKKDLAIQVLSEYEHQFSDDPLVIKMFANYCWAEGNRQKAIEKLMNLFTHSNKIWKKSDVEFELLGLCLTYSSIVAVERKDQLKVKLNLGEIKERSYVAQNKEVRQEFNRIHQRLGEPLFRRVKNQDLDHLSSAARQNVVTGLYHFSGVCMRLNKHDIACDICDFALQKSRAVLVESFKKRKKFLHSLQQSNQRKYGAKPEVSRGLRAPQQQRKFQAKVREGQRVNAKIISKYDMTVVVRLIDNQNEEVRFQQPAYPHKQGDLVKVKVQRVDAETGKVNRVIP